MIIGRINLGLAWKRRTSAFFKGAGEITRFNSAGLQTKLTKVPLKEVQPGMLLRPDDRRSRAGDGEITMASMDGRSDDGQTIPSKKAKAWSPCRDSVGRWRCFAPVRLAAILRCRIISLVPDLSSVEIGQLADKSQPYCAGSGGALISAAI